MSQTGLAAFDTTLHATNEWLKELMEGLGYTDRQKAYHALREVLHALRDRLPVDAVAALGAQLPLLVRGVYYEGWHPGDKPFKQHHDQFLGRVAESLRDRNIRKLRNRPTRGVRGIRKAKGAKAVTAGALERDAIPAAAYGAVGDHQARVVDGDKPIDLAFELSREQLADAS